MGSNPANRRVAVYAILITLGLAVCGWQAVEHNRFKRSAAEALINRGRDITETLRIVVRSQRRFGPIVTKDRLEPDLKEFIRVDDLEAIAFLSAAGDPVAGASLSPTGEAVVGASRTLEFSPAEIKNAGGVLWSGRTLTLMNLTNWDQAFVVDDSLLPNRPPGGRGAPAGTEGSASNPATPVPGAAPPQGGRTGRRFGQWMSREEFDALVQKQGVQSIVISLSTVPMQRAIKSDLLLRLLVSALAMGGAVISAFAWRNFGKNSELQIRLIKAGEMNTHLKEMNLAAAGLAHETRNPLNLIRGRAQMIAMQAKDAPALAENASIILEEADRVTVQLNEFINYSKPREAHLAPVDVQRLVADVSRTLQPDIEEKNLELTQPSAPVLIDADEQLFRQALFNVLLNAVQAVPSGGKIQVKITSTSGRGAVLEICDDGPGVPASDRVSIFKPYVTMRPKGVGLGLAIVAQIAAVHHWEVTCEANEPHGACFRFTGLRLASPAT